MSTKPVHLGGAGRCEHDEGLFSAECPSHIPLEDSVKYFSLQHFNLDRESETINLES